MTTAHGPAAGVGATGGRALIPPHPWSLTMTDPTAAAMLRDVEAYLSALHTHAARHDQLGADLTCAGCLLRDQIAEALPQLAAVPVPPADQTADRAALRQRIAEALEREDSLHCGYDHSFASQYGVDDETDGFVNAVLAVLPEPADRAAEVAKHVGRAIFSLKSPAPSGSEHYRSGWDDGLEAAMDAARDELLRRLAAEAQPTTKPEPDEDPARIDRLRPEFTEHASVESIDAQLRRSRAQERRWHIRTEWLISLRDDRVAQKARGEWPAAGVGQDGAQSP